VKPALLLVAVGAALFALYLLVDLRQNAGPGFRLDDSRIHPTFNRNLAHGDGIAFRPMAGMVVEF
jgi:hypothetical protein